MIYRIYSSLPTFKTLNFENGFNVLVAERSEEATKDQTRNAAGKSSTLEIIHYLLGSDIKPTSFSTNEVFENHFFGLIFDLGGQKIDVRRTAGTSKERNHFFFNGDIPKFISSELTKPKTGGEPYLSKTKWKDILGQYAFGLQGGNNKFQPTFRALFSYFCRRDEEGGFLNPFNQSEKQMDWDRNVMIAYLLGLDWRILSKMESLRLEEQHLDKLKKELKGSGLVNQIIGKSKSLRSNLTIEENRLRKYEKQVETFQVLPQYREAERESSSLARRIAELANANTIDQLLIKELSESLHEERGPERDDLERLYEAAGIQLPDVTLQKLESVKAFHKKIIENRRSYLESEISSAEERISKRYEESVFMDGRRQELMKLLQSHGALDQYNSLQEELSRLRSRVEIMKRQYEIAVKIESGGAALQVNRARLHQSLLNDLKARGERIDEAVLLYHQLSGEISQHSSVLEIEPTPRGLTFAITGGPDRSKGIREQQIFCFDILLSILNSRRKDSLGFLVHDSHLFDAMDERQVANAIEAGARLSKQHGFQYIITMNSDRIPLEDFSDDFQFDSFVIPTRITDETETGGLFGMRF